MNKKLSIIIIIMIAVCLVFTLSSCVFTSQIKVNKDVFDLFVGHSVDIEKHIAEYSSKMQIAVAVETNSPKSGESTTQVVEIKENKIIAKAVGSAVLKLTSKGNFVKNIQINVKAGGDIVGVVNDLTKLKLNTAATVAVKTKPESADMTLLKIEDKSGLLRIDGQIIIPNGVGEGTVELSFGDGTIGEKYEAPYKVSFNSVETLGALQRVCGISKTLFTKSELASYSYLFENYTFKTNDALSFSANDVVNIEYPTATDFSLSSLDEFAILQRVSLRNVNIIDTTTIAPIVAITFSGSVSGELDLNIPTLTSLYADVTKRVAVDVEVGTNKAQGCVASSEDESQDSENQPEQVNRLIINNNNSLLHLTLATVAESADIEIVGFDFMVFNSYSLGGGGLIVVNDCRNVNKADLSSCNNIEFKRMSNIENIDFNLFIGGVSINECNITAGSFSNINFTYLSITNCSSINTLTLSGMTNLKTLTLDNCHIQQLDILNCRAVTQASATNTIAQQVTIPKVDVSKSSALQHMVNILARQGGKVIINSIDDYEIVPGTFYIASWEGDFVLDDKVDFAKIIIDKAVENSTRQAKLSVNATVESIEFVNGANYSFKTIELTQGSIMPLALILNNTTLRGYEEFIKSGEDVNRDVSIQFSGSCEIGGGRGKSGKEGYGYRVDDYAEYSKSGESGNMGGNGYVAIQASNIIMETIGEGKASLIIRGGEGGIGGEGGDGQGSNGPGHSRGGRGGHGGRGGNGAYAMVCETLTVGRLADETAISIIGGCGGTGGQAGNGGHAYNGNKPDGGGHGGNGSGGGSSGGGMLVSKIQFLAVNTKATMDINSGCGGDGGNGGRGGDAHGNWWDGKGERGDGGNGGNGGDVGPAISFRGERSIVNQDYLTVTFTQPYTSSGGLMGFSGAGSGYGGSEGSSGNDGSKSALIITNATT